MYSYIDINQKTYDNLALQYAERDYEKSLDKEKTQTMANFILDYYKGNRKSFLEIGPGSGNILSYVSSIGFETIGVELSSVMSEVISRNCKDSIVINKNILDCDFLKKRFDLIYASAVVHLFPLDHASLLLKLIREWISDDGVFFVNTTIHKKNFEGYFRKTDYHSENLFRFRRFWSEDMFINFIQTSGFKIIKIFRTDENSRNKKWLGLTCKKLL